jgi:hypothetical protein
MNMIGHQYVCVNRAIVLARRFAQVFKKQPVIPSSKKCRLAIVATLYHVLGHANDTQAGSPCHTPDQCAETLLSPYNARASRKVDLTPFFSFLPFLEPNAGAGG